MKKILLLLLVTYSAMSQSFSVFDVDASNFPTIKAKFFAFDKDGNQIRNLSPSDFEVKENGQPREVTFVSCPAPMPPQALSSVLTIDVSGSMTGQSLENAKAAGRAWVEGLPLGRSECALTTFTRTNYCIQDFTSDKNKLLNAINSLNADGGTDFDAGFINRMSGALLIVEKGRYKKVSVFLTDGYANGSESEIIQKALSINASVFCVTLNKICPQILRNIAEQTGGQWFENITTNEQAEDVYRKILQIAQGSAPCEIEWQSCISCSAGITNVDIKLIPQNKSASVSYMSPITSEAKLEFNPPSVKFMNPAMGVSAVQKVTISAKNSDFTITNIKCSNPAFTIIPTSFELKSGQSRELTVSYLPADSGLNFCQFIIECTPCPATFYASGGWKGKKPKLRTLKLIHPNGGEVFVAGSDTVITWEGVLPDEPVKIEYKLNKTSKWITISDSAKGFSYKWHVPKTPSNECLARVTARSQISLNCINTDVNICGKTWMGCNLDVDTYRNGDFIPEVTDPTQWKTMTTGAWCYFENDAVNGGIYGKLYNWYAVNDPRGLAPEGWHIPSDEEWTELENCLGGADIAGGKLKSTGTLDSNDGFWVFPNIGATNESGLLCFPGGYRFEFGEFYYLGVYACFWTSSEEAATVAYQRSLYNSNENLRKNLFNKACGFSVRCVKD